MLAELDLALSKPTELIQQLFEQHGSLDGLEQVICDRFTSLIKDGGALAQVPSLTSLSTVDKLPANGSLVRFRGMVQDTGLGGELFPATNADGSKLFMYGREDDAADVAAEDYSKLRERQLFYVVSVPGETAWAKEKLDQAPAEALRGALENLSLKDGAAASHLTAHKNPIPTEPSFGLVAKIYGETDESLKTTDVREFVGVLGATSWSTGLEDPSSAEASESLLTVPALHVLFSSPAPRPSGPELPSSESRAALRNELVDYLASSLGEDRDAAEWLLLALVARIHTRHATGMALGSMSLNLALPDGFSTDIGKAIEALVPAAAALDLTIETLNDAKTRLAPRSRDETLDAGRLQLAPGTAVVVDLRTLGEGKLEDTGVRNLRHLATAITQQKLAYEFPYSSFELDTDLNFVLLSEGKAILPTDCVVYVRPTSSSGQPVRPDASKLDQFRGYIAAMKHSQFSIPAEMSEVIQSDFVERRQASQGGEAMTQDDLLFRMTAARLLALSYGETELSKEAWMRTAELDDRRKERFPVAPATQQQQQRA
ncbi:hypothetical protein C6P46_005989 [Rhodotorula mucilaginosa]|uniref:Mini-chromosome maintenance complex-binding protein n=1 Tax=Rhodotorula mucilaginosa TaxID=5537 RepID=A0A9P7B9C1_RHOMI|nr:hypothetical protein C6P46_005989 [Rhodotorula mucilaginosa]